MTNTRANSNVSEAQAAHLEKARVAALRSRRLKLRERLAKQLADLDVILSGGSSDDDTDNVRKKCSEAAVALRYCNLKRKTPDSNRGVEEAAEKKKAEEKA
eukprot:7385053-Prymnesium_polylepis.1